MSIRVASRPAPCDTRHEESPGSVFAGASIPAGFSCWPGAAPSVISLLRHCFSRHRLARLVTWSQAEPHPSDKTHNQHEQQKGPPSGRPNVVEAGERQKQKERTSPPPQTNRKEFVIRLSCPPPAREGNQA